MKRPFVFLSVSLVLGILVGNYLDIDLVFYIIGLSVFLLSYILSKEDSRRNISIFFMVFILGIFIFKVNSIETIEVYRDMDVELRGYVESIDKLEEYSRYIINVDRLDGKKISKKEKVLLTTGQNNLDIGDLVKIKTTLKLPSENTNPLLFNYRNYLRSRNIRVTAYGEDGSIEKIGRKDSLLLNGKKNILEKVEASFHKISEKNKSFLLSMVLGDSNFMEAEDLDSFRKLGLAHILAVSGLHLGIITSALIALLSFLTLDRKIINIISIIFIFSYSYIIGFPPSILRAGIMLSIHFLSMNMKKYSDRINNLFFVSFILLVLNPYIIFSVGFQLSFFATLSVMTIPKYIKQYYIKSDNKIINSLITIIGVQIGLMPIQIYYFNYINILGIVSNLLIVPLIGIILPMTLLLFVLPARLVFIGDILSLVTNLLLDLVFFIKDYFIGLNIGGFKLASPSLVGIFFYYLVLMVIIRKIRIDFLPKNINRFILISFLLIILVNVGLYNSDDSLELNFIDVDQGDSILVSQKGKDYLIDTGGNIFKKFDIGKNILIPYLDKRGVKTLDAVFISHFDADHCKSLVDILNEIKVKKIFVGHIPKDNELFIDILNKSKEKNVGIALLTKGDRLKLSDDIKIDVLGPNKNIDYSLSENDLSLVFNLEYKNKKILFTGDIEEYGENLLIEDNIGRVDFIKVPHHGSKTSSKMELLELLLPREAFIQVGKNNSFSHPNKEVLERYDSIGTNINRTDESGMIKLYIKDNNYEIRKYKDKKYSIMNVIVKYKYIIIFNILYILMLIYVVRLYIGNKEWDSFEL